MSDNRPRPRGTRQLAGLAASGGLVFYVLLIVGFALLVGILAALHVLKVVA